MITQNLSLAFPCSPALAAALFVLAAVAVLVFFRARKGGWGRLLLLFVLLWGLFDIRLLSEMGRSGAGTALLFLDESLSQRYPDRVSKMTSFAAGFLTESKKIGRINVRLVRPGQKEDKGEAFEAALDKAFHTDAGRRFSHAVFVTDGQVPIAPLRQKLLNSGAAFFPVLTDKKGQKDRLLQLDSLPEYGVAGKDLLITGRVLGMDTLSPEETVSLSVTDAFGRKRQFPVSVSEDFRIPLSLPFAERAEFLFELPVAPEEVSPLNNKRLVSVPLAPDAVQVLIVGQAPRMGGRSLWDAVQRDPSIQTRFLYLNRQNDWEKLLAHLSGDAERPHILVLDKVNWQSSLFTGDRPALAMAIASFVKKGGALTVLAGPSYASFARDEMESTLGEILPPSPTGRVLSHPASVRRSLWGEGHPVTRSLYLGDRVGRWLRHVDVAESGSHQATLLTENGAPLLTLAQIEKGRVAFIASDVPWLWAVGYDGGGPWAALRNNLFRWSLGDPAFLSERPQIQKQQDKALILSLGGLHAEKDPLVSIETPLGDTQDITLSRRKDGKGYRAVLPALPGPYLLRYKTRFAAIGFDDRDLNASFAVDRRPLLPLTKRFGGQISRITGETQEEWKEQGRALARTIADNARKNKERLQLKEAPFPSDYLRFLICLGLVFLVWLREKKKIETFKG